MQTENPMRTLTDVALRRALTVNTPPTPRQHSQARRMPPASRS